METIFVSALYCMSEMRPATACSTSSVVGEKGISRGGAQALNVLTQSPFRSGSIIKPRLASDSPLSPIAISLSPSVAGGTASAEVHGYWDIVHGWGCICGVVVLRAAPLLVVALPVILEEGLSGLVVEALKWGPSCKAFLQDAFNYCSSLGE